jgi:hypothetical protein
MKSRIAGSVTQARLSAALVSSTGTPDPRNDRMSVLALIDWSGGKLARSQVAEVGDSVGGVAAVAWFKSPASA